MTQHSFVVTYDTETKKWDWDVDTEMTRFDTGTIWDGKDWHRSGDNPKLGEMDTDIGENLWRGLRFMNWHEENYGA